MLSETCLQKTDFAVKCVKCDYFCFTVIHFNVEQFVFSLYIYKYDNFFNHQKKNVKSILSFSNPLSQSLFFLAHNEYNGINIQSWDHFKKIERVYHCISDSNPFTLYPDVVYLCWTTKSSILLKYWSLRNTCIDTRELIHFVY